MSAPKVAVPPELHHRRSSASTATPTPASFPPPPSSSTARRRRTSSHSIYARNVLMNRLAQQNHDHANHSTLSGASQSLRPASAAPALPVAAPPKSVQEIKEFAARHGELKLPPTSAQSQHFGHSHAPSRDGVGVALSDTPLPSHPGSPRECVNAMLLRSHLHPLT
jgi:6-phosphofructo-2-kinase